MTPLEEFKEKIKAGEMFDALAIAMSESIELNITTWVASSEDQQLDETSQPGYRMRTRINLVDGEVDNEVGREFASNPAYAELQKLHMEQVKQGREILLNNLASLQSMFVMLNDTQSTMAEIPAKPKDKSLPES
jgi:hypothetical protein